MNDKQQTSEWAALNEIPNVSAAAERLPAVLLPGKEESFTASGKELFPRLARTKRYFMRGGRPMKLGKRDDDLLVLSLFTPEEFRSEIEKIARLFVLRALKNGETVWCPTTCTSDTAKGLLASSEAKEFLPPVRGLINCPVLYEKDGKLLTAGPGYNPDTKLLVTGGEMPPEINLETAVSELMELLAEFDFQSQGDKARAMASFLSPALKLANLISGRVPADVAEADKSQSGKTYRQKLVAAIYNELVSVIAKRDGGVGSMDETLSQHLVAGRSFIQLDNFRGKLDSQYLEAFLTAEGIFSCRIPHLGNFDIKPDDFFIFMSSNGVETTRDFANRSSIIRVRKKLTSTFASMRKADCLSMFGRTKLTTWVVCSVLLGRGTALESPRQMIPSMIFAAGHKCLIGLFKTPSNLDDLWRATEMRKNA